MLGRAPLLRSRDRGPGPLRRLRPAALPTLQRSTGPPGNSIVLTTGVVHRDDLSVTVCGGQSDKLTAESAFGLHETQRFIHKKHTHQARK